MKPSRSLLCAALLGVLCADRPGLAGDVEFKEDFQQPILTDGVAGWTGEGGGGGGKLALRESDEFAAFTDRKSGIPNRFAVLETNGFASVSARTRKAVAVVGPGEKLRLSARVGRLLSGQVPDGGIRIRDHLRGTLLAESRLCGADLAPGASASLTVTFDRKAGDSGVAIDVEFFSEASGETGKTQVAFDDIRLERTSDNIEVFVPTEEFSLVNFVPDFGVMVSSKVPGEDFFYLLDPVRSFCLVGVLREERGTFKTLRTLWFIPQEQPDLALQISFDGRGFPVELLWTDGSRMELSLARTSGAIRVTGFGADRKKRFTADQPAASESGSVTIFSPALPVAQVLARSDIDLATSRSVALGIDHALDLVNARIDTALAAAESSGRSTALWARAFRGYAQDELGRAAGSSGERNYDVFRERYDFGTTSGAASAFFRNRTSENLSAMQVAVRGDSNALNYRVKRSFSLQVDAAGAVRDVSMPPPPPSPTPAAPLAEVSVSKVNGAIRLDGKASPAEWQQAAKVVSPMDQTVYHLRATKRHLYILVDQTAVVTAPPEVFFYPLLFDLTGDRLFTTGSDIAYFTGPETQTEGIRILKARADALGYFREGDFMLGSAGPSSAAVAVGFGPSPSASSPHQLFEIAIPLSELAISGGKIAARLGAADPVTLVIKD